jgi:hypothetical protein
VFHKPGTGTGDEMNARVAALLQLLLQGLVDQELHPSLLIPLARLTHSSIEWFFPSTPPKQLM